jgi:hypothetical protein
MFTDVLDGCTGQKNKTLKMEQKIELNRRRRMENGNYKFNSFRHGNKEYEEWEISWTWEY